MLNALPYTPTPRRGEDRGRGICCGIAIQGPDYYTKPQILDKVPLTIQGPWAPIYFHRVRCILMGTSLVVLILAFPAFNVLLTYLSYF